MQFKNKCNYDTKYKQMKAFSRKEGFEFLHELIVDYQLCDAIRRQSHITKTV